MHSVAPTVERSARPPEGVASPRLFPAVPLGFAAALGLLAFLPPIAGHARLTTTFVAVALGLIGWTAWLAWRARATGRELALELVPPQKSHYVQGCVQLSIYAYWAMYWPKVLDAAPLIVGQMFFLFAFDGLLQLSRGRHWRLGLGPVPIVFSTNLFMWFKDDWFAFQFAMLASCALAKEFIRWERDGKNTHIFNPSAFGLSLVSIVLIATNTTHLTWGIEVATTLGLAPHMYAWIFFVGLIVQYFFAVTLMTVSAAVVLYVGNLIYTRITGVYFFVDTGIPIAVFLGLHLLVTDPATSPKSSLGRILFGGAYGLANLVLFWVLGGLNVPDFYDKLLPVPLLNLTVKALDAFARLDAVAWFTRWEARLRAKELNYVHMGAWSAVFASMFATGFVEAPHPGNSIEFWRRAYVDGKPAAGRNWMKMVGTSADAGDARSCEELGRIYAAGEIVPASPGAAAHYFARSCELGWVPGCESVARHFLEVGVAASEPAARRAFDVLEARLASANDGRAGFWLGLAYERGQGRPRDVAKAFACYAASARRGDLGAAQAVTRFWLAGLGDARELPFAAPPIERAAAGGDGTSQFLLAHLAHAGFGVARDDARAEALLGDACRSGVADACAALAANPRWQEPAHVARR